ncbi:MAG: M16 family metallopeptidase [Alphaproteobacteria bacterium]
MAQKLTTLASGLRVVTDTVASADTVAVGAWIDIGARFENPALNGISHFLEHMAFKGTEKRTALQIAQEIENVGGYMNAYTSRERTAYYAKVLKEDWRLGLDIVSDILQNSTFNEEELERERGVIIQEIGRCNDTPDDIVFDYFQETAFADQALGRPVLGTIDIVNAISQKNLRDYIAKYNTKNMVVAAAGAIEHDAFVAEVQEKFAALPIGEKKEYTPANYTGGDFRQERDLDQVHLILGLEAVSNIDPDREAYHVYNSILGEGMSSRLFQEVREKRGLVYSVYSYLSAYKDTGLLGIYAGTGEKEAAELVPVICAELQKQDFKEGEIKRAKAQLKSSLLMGQETMQNRIERMATSVLNRGKLLSDKEKVAAIEAVTEDDLIRVNKTLLSKELSLTAVGKTANVAAYDKVGNMLV